MCPILFLLLLSTYCLKLISVGQRFMLFAVDIFAFSTSLVAVFDPENRLLPNIPITTMTAKTTRGSGFFFILILQNQHKCR